MPHSKESAETSDIELSVVVLCYQSEGFARVFCNQLIGELDSMMINYEIILVANFDSEQDKTPNITRELAKENNSVRVISMPKSGKMGWDMKMGLESAVGKYIAVIDGDGQMPCSDIPIVYKIMQTGDFDLVKTSRAIRYDSIYRSILSWTYNFIFNLLFRPKVYFKDVNSKPKIISKECYKKLHLESNDWFTDAEIMIQAIDLRLKICEISTVFYPNERRSSFVNMRTVIEFITNLIRYRFFRSQGNRPA
ncbi:MAG: glycosyltransferase family 2 protein [Flavobacteriales bacterium]|nr:glycosyltransferase family 2 protein [Flavobacteriales bacterium]MCB9204185.1 glycosyltransferase family 2 protein [Flavobacteriales bacterium]